MSEPRDQLTTPVSQDPIPDLVENILGGTQFVSVSYWLGWAADKALHTDPWVWVSQQFAGDWEAVYRAGDAIERIGDFNDVFANNLSAGLSTVECDWRGNAADAAGSYFDDLTTTVKGQVEDLRALGSEFKTVAVGMYETSNSLKGFFNALTDMLLAAGLSAAAALASNWTVIGGVLGGAATAASLLAAAGIWGKILEWHTIAWNAAQGFVGVCAGYLGAINSGGIRQLPACGYDHPAV